MSTRCQICLPGTPYTFYLPKKGRRRGRTRHWKWEGKKKKKIIRNYSLLLCLPNSTSLLLAICPIVLFLPALCTIYSLHFQTGTCTLIPNLQSFCSLGMCSPPCLPVTFLCMPQNLVKIPFVPWCHVLSFQNIPLLLCDCKFLAVRAYSNFAYFECTQQKHGRWLTTKNIKITSGMLLSNRIHE